MKPFTLELNTEYRCCSQLRQLDLHLPFGFEINGDRELRFRLKLVLQYEHLQEHPELLKLFRERSDLSKYLERPSIENLLVPLTKLVGIWGQAEEDYHNRIIFSGSVPYNLHNLETFLEYFRK